MIISWKVWQAVHKPFVAHPLYWMRGLWIAPYDTEFIVKKIEKRARSVSILVGIFALFLLVQYGVGTFTLFVLGLPALVIIFGIPLGILIIGSIYGFVSASVATLTISREHNLGRFTLLGTTPYGRAGATWALGSIAIQKNEFLRRVRDVMPPVYFATFFLILFPLSLLGFGALLNSSNSELQGNFTSIFMIFTLSLFSLTDLIQSASIGALIGMIVPITVNQTSSAYAITILAYLVSQVFIYLISAAIWILVWPQFGVSQGIKFYLAGLCTIILFRDVYLRILWQLFNWRLGADFGELDMIVHINVLSHLWRAE